jgi:resuscitation-promoting factor RpfB
MDKLKKKINKLKTRFIYFIKHPLVFIPLGSFILILSVILSIYHFAANSLHLKTIPNSKIVIISHDGEKQVVPTSQKTVGDLLKAVNIAINPGDVVEPDKSTLINQDDFRINIYRGKPVKVVENGNVIYATSAAATPRAIAIQAGIQLYAEDVATTNPSENILSNGAIGVEIDVTRATPFSLNIYGNTYGVRTQAKTVGAYLSEQKIKLAANDKVTPDVNTPITEGMTVSLILTGQKTVTIKETIPTPINQVYDDNLAYGTTAIRQAGSPGQRVVTYKQNLQNGVVVSQDVLNSVTIIQPVTEIVAVGTSLSGIKGDMALAGIAPGDYTYADYIISHESGWCATKAQGEHYCPAFPDNQYTSNGYGLCQATPGYKMQSSGSDWATNPITQLEWCSGYAKNRYGNWYNAYVYWINHANW